MKLIYQDEYSTVDKNMSDSNIGARKKKNIRNHLFIINSIINESFQTKNPVDIIISDYRQCFDSLWLEEVINDLYDNEVKNRNLSLIFEANKVNKFSVITPSGPSDKASVERIVMQGETLAPLECSSLVDTIGKECIKEGKLLYMYRGV